MSRLRVRIGEEDFETLDAALARPEEVVFLYAAAAANTFTVTELEVMAGASVASRSAEHVELADDVRGRVIKTAWDREECLIEAHSHGSRGIAQFSLADLRAFDDWVPHVRWRLRRRPYLALVRAGESWDALVWIDARPTSIDVIEICDGSLVVKTIIPTGATATRLRQGAPT